MKCSQTNTGNVACIASAATASARMAHGVGPSIGSGRSVSGARLGDNAYSNRCHSAVSCGRPTPEGALPTRPLHPCNAPRCSRLTAGRFCASHSKRADKRPHAAARGYDGRWRQLRAMILRRDPICVMCRQAPSTDVDHVVAKAKGGTDEASNLAGLCHACHSRKTATVDSGFGNAMRGVA